MCVPQWLKMLATAARHPIGFHFPKTDNTRDMTRYTSRSKTRDTIRVKTRDDIMKCGTRRHEDATANRTTSRDAMTQHDKIHETHVTTGDGRQTTLHDSALDSASDERWEPLLAQRLRCNGDTGDRRHDLTVPGHDVVERSVKDRQRLV